MKKSNLIVAILFISFSASYGQNKTDTVPGHKLHYEIINGDTVANAEFENIILYPQPVFKSKKDEMKYWRLIYNLKIVYPYAKMAGAKFKEMNEHFLTLKTEREKNIYTKQVEKEIRKEFESQLVDLTVSQGRLLIKLIYRETGKTSYELLKEFRGDFSAVFWQTMARLFGSNLKTTYDPTGADKQIEEILNAIDAGNL